MQILIIYLVYKHFKIENTIGMIVMQPLKEFVYELCIDGIDFEPVPVQP